MQQLAGKDGSRTAGLREGYKHQRYLRLVSLLVRLRVAGRPKGDLLFPRGLIPALRNEEGNPRVRQAARQRSLLLCGGQGGCLALEAWAREVNVAAWLRDKATDAHSDSWIVGSLPATAQRDASQAS